MPTALRSFFTLPTVILAGAFNLGLLYMITCTDAYATDTRYTALESALMLLYMPHVALFAIVMDALLTRGTETPVLGPAICFIVGLPVSLLYARLLVGLWNLARRLCSRSA